MVHERKRWSRWLLGALGVLLVFGLVIRLVADPLAAKATRRALAGMDEYLGTFERVHVTFFPPGSVIEGLKLVDKDAPRGQPPALYVERATSVAAWRQALRGDMVVNQRITGMKATFARPFNAQLVKRVEQLSRKVPDLLRQLPRARVERMELSDGELLFIDTSQPEKPRLWLHGLRAVTTNMVTRPDMDGGRPLQSTLSGRVQRSGRLWSQLSVPQGGSALTFDMRTALEGLALSELHGFLKARTDLHAPRGTLSTYARVDAERGRLSGWMRAAMDDVEIRPAKGKEDEPADRLKAWLADKSVELLSDDDKGQEDGGPGKLATTVPIRGRIDPQRSLLASLGTVLQSSFSQALRQAMPGEQQGEKGEDSAASRANGDRLPETDEAAREAVRPQRGRRAAASRRR